MMPMQPRDIVPQPPNATLTYEQSSQLMMDATFRGRVKVACLQYATYIDNEASSTAGHNSRMRWASSCIQMPDQTAQTVTNPVVMDPGVQAMGSAIGDTGLQAAVEKVIDGLI